MLDQILQQLANIQDWVQQVIANKKEIHEFPELTTLEGSEYVAVSKNGETKKTLVSNFINSSAPEYILIEGNRFRYEPILGGVPGNFQLGDLALNGWISQTNWGKILSYSGGDPTLFSSWEIIEDI